MHTNPIEVNAVTCTLGWLIKNQINLNLILFTNRQKFTTVCFLMWYIVNFGIHKCIAIYIYVKLANVANYYICYIVYINYIILNINA